MATLDTTLGQEVFQGEAVVLHSLGVPHGHGSSTLGLYCPKFRSKANAWVMLSRSIMAKLVASV